MRKSIYIQCFNAVWLANQTFRALLQTLPKELELQQPQSARSRAEHESISSFQYSKLNNVCRPLWANINIHQLVVLKNCDACHAWCLKS